MATTTCVHCQAPLQTAALHEGRCPRCMRKIDDVASGAASSVGRGGAGQPGRGEPRGRETAEHPHRSRWHPSEWRAWQWTVVLGLLGAAAGTGWWWWTTQRSIPPEAFPLKPVAFSRLSRSLQKDLSPAELAAVRPSPQVVAKAKVLGKSATEPVDAIRGYFWRLRETGRVVPISTEQARARAPRTPNDLLRALDKASSTSPAHASSLEVALLALVLLRELDAPALLVELCEIPGQPQPLDPEGLQSPYGVSVDAKKVLYPLDGRLYPVPELPQSRRLTDAQLFAGVLVHRAVAEQASLRLRQESVDRAIQLDPRASSARVLQASLALQAGSAEQALREFEAAAQLCGGAAQHLNVARVALLAGHQEQALSSLRASLKQKPDFWHAHLALAEIHLTHEEFSEADEKLAWLRQRKALPIERGLLRAAMAISQQKPAAARQALAQTLMLPKVAWQHRLQGAQLYLALGDAAVARQTFEAALRQAPPAHQDALKELAHQTFGVASAPMGSSPPAAAAASALDRLPSPRGMQLRSPGLLEEPASDADPPQDGSTAQPSDADSADGPALMLGDPNNFRLRDPGDTLHLNN